MKHIQIILGLVLFASVTTFAQSPRIKLNQITKDTVKGSVLISSPTDSGMVYSRDFYVAYGADTVLILYGDTLGGVGGGFASVLSDGVTITGDGTSGNELKVDTSTVISTIQGLVDTLSARGYLTANQTITLSGDVTGSGTTSITATVVDDSHNHIISNVDFLQDSLTAKANASELSNYVTIAGTETITGAKTFTANTVFDDSTLVVDADNNRVGIGTSTPQNSLDIIGKDFVITNYSSNTSFAGSPGFALNKVRNDTIGVMTPSTNGERIAQVFFQGVTTNNTFRAGSGFRSDVDGTPDASDVPMNFTIVAGNNQDALRITSGLDIGIGTLNPTSKLEINHSSNNYTNGLTITNQRDWGFGSRILFRVPLTSGSVVGNAASINQGFDSSNNYHLSFATTTNGTLTEKMRIAANGNVGIGTSSPSYPLEMGSGAHVTTGGVWTDASDIKLKENINYYYPYGLNQIINLKPTVFDYINGEKNSLGFIAQDVFEVIPEAISSTLDENGNETMGIKMVSITATLVKAIQEQQTEIDQLKTLITDLTNRLIILENK